MCIEAIQRYNGCSCKTIRHLICTKHVDETRKQLNTAPCPELELRLLETQEGGCGRRVQSRPCKTDTSWTFENWTDHRHRPGSRKFCEERMTGKHTCDDGRWLLGRDHTCGVGSGEMRWWRHRFIPKHDVKSKEKTKKPSLEMKSDADMEGRLENMTLEDIKMEES